MQRTKSDSYREAGFGHQVHRGARPAIVVVDLTRGFTDPDFPLGADGTAVVESTNQILDVAHRTAIPVIFTRIAYSHPDQGRAWRTKAPGLEALAEGTAATEFDPRLRRRPTDVELVKFGASAFFDTALRSILHSAGADTLVVCGATTSGCVRATAVDGMQCGYGVLVPRQAVLDRAEQPHQAALFDLDQKYADVVDTVEVADYLTSCTPTRDA